MPYSLPLSDDDFKFALVRGLGRALQHVRTFPLSADQFAALLDACTRETVFDPQCEGSRAAWMVALIDAANAWPRLREPIFATAAEIDVNAHWDRRHLCRLLGEMARAGDEAAKAAIYREVERNTFSAQFVGERELLELDGLAGLLFCAAQRGQVLRETPGSWADRELIDDAAEVLGDDEFVIAELEMAAESNADIRAFLDAIAERAPGAKSFPGILKAPNGAVLERPKPIAGMTAADVLAYLDADDADAFSYGVMYAQWGKRADANELPALLDALDRETHPGRMFRLLCVFQEGKLPAFDARLLRFLDHTDSKIEWVAHRALRHYTAPEIREVALQRLAAGRLSDLTMHLFVANIAPDDCERITTALKTGHFAEMDANQFHWMLDTLGDTVEANPDRAWRTALEFAYEQTPCMNCRQKFVKLLGINGGLPDWIRAECADDASDWVQETARDAALVGE